MKRVLFDEDVPNPLRFRLSAEFVIATVDDMGWKSRKNGFLLRSAVELGFDTLVTGDCNMGYQQNLPAYAICVIQLEEKNWKK